MRSFALLAFLPALGLAAPAPAPAAAPPQDSVKITNIVYGGTGCNQGSLDVRVTPNGDILGLKFKDFTAQIGPRVPITEIRKNCQVNLAIQFPAGFSYSVLSADYFGYAKLNSGVTGAIQSNYYFSGSTEQDTTRAEINGPFEGSYTKSDRGNVAVWSPCGRTEGLLNINSQLVLDSNNNWAYGILTQRKIEASFEQVVALQWKQC